MITEIITFGIVQYFETPIVADNAIGETIDEDGHDATP